MAVRGDCATSPSLSTSSLNKYIPGQPWSCPPASMAAQSWRCRRHGRIFKSSDQNSIWSKRFSEDGGDLGENQTEKSEPRCAPLEYMAMMCRCARPQRKRCWLTGLPEGLGIGLRTPLILLAIVREQFALVCRIPSFITL